MKLAIVLSAVPVSDIVRQLSLVVGRGSDHTLRECGVSGDSIVWLVQCTLVEDNVVDLIASRFGRGIHITGTEGTSWALGGVDL